MKSLGEQIRLIRKSLGLSQEDLAFKADIDQSYLSQIERIGPGSKGLGIFLKLVDALDCDLILVPKKADPS